MSRRYYSTTALRTTLASSCTSGATSIVVSSVSGFPATTPYTLIVDADTVNEEIVEVTSRSGTTLTVTRGVDGSSAVAHSSGATVQHGVSARDFDEANSHVNASTGVHGVTGAVVGTTDTQVLTNKTISQSQITNLTSDLALKANLSGGTFTGAVYLSQGATIKSPTAGDGSYGVRQIYAAGFTPIGHDDWGAEGDVWIQYV